MTFSFLNHQSKTVGSAVFLLMGSALASRLLGLARDGILAGRFGAGDTLDMYYAAFQIPDFIFSILFMGAISVAFLPLFTDYWHREQKEAWHFSNVVLNAFLLFLTVISLALLILAPVIIHFVAPGFDGAKKDTTVNLTRIMFFSPFFLGISSIFGSVLQGLRRFFVYSLTPIMYNIGIIFGAIFLTPFWGVYGLAVGVVAGAILHLAIQVPSIAAAGFRYKFIFDFRHAGLKNLFIVMMPRTVGLAALQINIIVMTAVASMISSGSIAVFNFANNLQYLPVGILGVSFATAMFPVLSQSVTFNQKEEFNEKFSRAMRMVVFAAIPISFAIFILRVQIVRLILGFGEFGWVDTRLTAATLGIFSFGIIAQCLIPLFSRAFFSLKDTKTPVVIGIASVILNIFMALVFLSVFNSAAGFAGILTAILKIRDVGGASIIVLPLAIALSSIFNAALLYIAMSRKIKLFEPKTLLLFLLKIMLCSIFMAVYIYLALRFAALFVDTHTRIGIFLQTVFAALTGMSVFSLFATLFKIPEFEEVKKYFFDRKNKIIGIWTGKRI